jgi:predicted metal-dependent hydrolase
VNKNQKVNCILRGKDREYIEVTTDGSLTVAEVEEHLRKRIDFVKDKLPITLNENILHVRGIAYTPIFVIDKTSYVKINYNHIIIAAEENNAKLYFKVLYDFYEDILKEEMNKIILEAKRDFREIVFPKINYHFYKSRFGHYDLRTNEITINTVLGKYEPKYLKITLYHELCHAIVPNHSKEFYKYFETKYKDARKEDLLSRKKHYFDCL